MPSIKIEGPEKTMPSSNGRGSLRPSGRSPPFVLIGLSVVLCIIGFNYWSVSSRNSELLNQITILKTELSNEYRIKLAAEKRSAEANMKSSKCNEEKAEKYNDLNKCKMEKSEILERVGTVEKSADDCVQSKKACENDRLGINERVNQIQAELDAEKEKNTQSEKKCDENACRQHIGNIINILTNSLGKDSVRNALSQSGVDYQSLFKDLVGSSSVQGTKPYNQQEDNNQNKFNFVPNQQQQPVGQPPAQEQNAGQGQQPGVQGQQPDVQGQQPVVQGQQPGVQGQQQGEQGQEQAGQGPQPAVQGQEQAGQGPQPAVQGLQPGQEQQAEQGQKVGQEPAKQQQAEQGQQQAGQGQQPGQEQQAGPGQQVGQESGKQQQVLQDLQAGQAPGQPQKEQEPGQPQKEQEPGQPQKEQAPGEQQKEQEPGQPQKEQAPGEPQFGQEPGKPQGRLEPGKKEDGQEPGQQGQLKGGSKLGEQIGSPKLGQNSQALPDNLPNLNTPSGGVKANNEETPVKSQTVPPVKASDAKTTVKSETGPEEPNFEVKNQINKPDADPKDNPDLKEHELVANGNDKMIVETLDKSRLNFIGRNKVGMDPAHQDFRPLVQKADKDYSYDMENEEPAQENKVLKDDKSNIVIEDDGIDKLKKQLEEH